MKRFCFIKRIVVFLFAIGFLLNAYNLDCLAINNGEIDIATAVERKVSELEKMTTDSLLAVAQKEAPAKKGYYTLLENLSTQLNSGASIALSKSVADQEMTLQNYYGGAFINEEKQLTIYAATTDSEVLSAFAQASGNEEAVVIACDYTYEGLENLINNIVKLPFDKHKEIGIQSWVLDVVGNRVVVRLNDLSVEKKQAFFEVFDYIDPNMIVFEEAGEIVLTERIRPGSPLWIMTNNGLMFNQSVGFRAYRINSSGNRVNGFTSAGHATELNVYRNGAIVGTLYKRAFSGSHDSSFYDAAAGTILLNETAYSDTEGGDDAVVTISTSTSIPNIVGETIAKVGGASFYTQGVVRSNQFGYRDEQGVVHSNMYETTVYNTDGDSGGCAFYCDVGDGGKYKIVGQMSAAVLSNGSFNYSIIGKGCHDGTPFSEAIYLY